MERRLPLGSACRKGGRCSFLVWAPAAKRVELRILPPGGRIVALQRLRDGYHGAVLDGVRPGDLYVYRLDGLIERPDPASRSQPLGPSGPSQVTDPRPPATVGPWPGLALRDAVLTEPGESDRPFDSIRSRIGGYVSPGFNALRVRTSAGRGFPFSVSAPAGGPAGLKRLVGACHRRGVAVMLAVDLFEPGIEGDPLAWFGPYFAGHDRRLNLDGPWSDEVRRYFIECAMSWFREYRVDALDIGPVDAVADPSPLPLLEEMAQAVKAEARRVGRPLHLVAHSERNDPRLVRLPEDGGMGLDAVWNPDFAESLDALLLRPRGGAGSGFGRLEHVRKAFLEGFVDSGGYSPARRRRRGRSSRALPGERFLVRLQPPEPGRDGRRGTVGAGALLEACLFLSPFLPLLPGDADAPAGAARRAGLIRLRKELRAAGLLDRQCMGVLGYERERVLLVRHWKDDEDLIVIFHFGTRASTVALPVPAGAWALRFDTAAPRWGGPGSALPERLQGEGGDVPLPLAPLSCAVYLKQHGERTEVEKL
ncbi:MAG: DUF3459 domain-containing protein [Syntrophaceae bacterium]|nr:DUF3459 domain-containing protein [Syntrophaceae bacterium]